MPDAGHGVWRNRKGDGCTGGARDGELRGQTVLGGQREMVAVAESSGKDLGIAGENRSALTYWAAGYVRKESEKNGVCLQAHQVDGERRT